MSALLRSALIYSQKYKMSIFPLKKCDKIPITPAGFKNSTTDSSKIKKYWSDYPQSNIGLWCNGLLVVDVDVKNDIDGRESLRELIEGKNWPATVMQLTGGGGEQYFFRCPDGIEIKNSAGEIAPGIDIRGQDGYVVLPPSIHPNGRQYVWEASSRIDEVKMAMAPTWLLDLCRKGNRSSHNRKTSERSSNIENIYHEGGRNSHLASLAGTMFARNMSRDSVLAALTTENERNCKPSLPVSEVETIVNSVFKYDHEEQITLERDLIQEIDDLNLSVGRAEINNRVNSILQYASQLSPLEQEEVIEAVCKKTGRGRSFVKAQIKTFIVNNQRQRKQSVVIAKDDSFETVVKKIGNNIYYPANPDKTPRVCDALFLLTSEFGKRLVPIFDQKMHGSAPFVRHIIGVIADNMPECDIDELSQELERSSQVRRILNSLLTRADIANIGTVVKLHSGPFTDFDNFKFNVVSDIMNKKIIKMGDYLIDSAVTPAFDEIRFNLFKKFYADNWQKVWAMALNAVLHLSPKAKPILAIVGGPGCGKSTLGRFLMLLVQNKKVEMTARELIKSAKVFLDNRILMIDNVDKKLLEDEDQSLLTQICTSDWQNFPLRYSQSGAEGEPCYVIVTTTNPDIFSSYPAMKSRTVKLFHNPNVRQRAEIELQSEQLAIDLRPTLYYHAQQIVRQWADHVRNNEPTKGGERFRGFAFCYWWVLRELCNENDANAIEQCEILTSDDTTDDNPDSFTVFMSNLLDRLDTDGRGRLSFTIKQLSDEIASSSILPKWLRTKIEGTEKQQPIANFPRWVRDNITQNAVNGILGEWSMASVRKLRECIYYFDRIKPKTKVDEKDKVDELDLIDQNEEMYI